MFMVRSGLGDSMVYRATTAVDVALPLVSANVRAGFPSPAEDYVEGALDLNEHLIRHPAATFIVRVTGESMSGAGILPGDLLIVDRSVEAIAGHIVIAVVGGEMTVKRLKKTHRLDGGAACWMLEAEHPDFPPILLEDELECVVWGVVSGSARRFL